MPAEVKIALVNQRPCAHWPASFRMVGKQEVTQLADQGGEQLPYSPSPGTQE
jgi:hypothetical protein